MERQNNNKKDEFLKINDKEGLAGILDIPYKTLMYYLYVLPPEKKYYSFEIQKRNGKLRQIYAPVPGLKAIQSKLATILSDIYPGKICVHGYTKTKDIKTNARLHSNKRFLLNIDFKDFFPSINFGRVQGLFKAYPFNFPEEIATALAQICCHAKALPQGAPTSPIISNFICYRLDNQLLALSAKYKVTYTRYADDLTFSTNLHRIPEEIATIKDNVVILSNRLIETIQENGFIINEAKTRYALKNNRQEVTGLIVNSGVNVNRKFVRTTRAMLHAWEKYSLADAAKEHFTIYRKNTSCKNMELKFKHILVGKINYIGHIKGKNDPVYGKLLERLARLIPEISLSSLNSILNPEFPTVFCEGKTDSLHLQAALNWFKKNKEFEELQINFFNHKDDYNINNQELLKACQTLGWTKTNNTIAICLFDRDDNSINNKAGDPLKNYKHWHNNVFSVILPIPPHRNFTEICIEHYYTDKELTTKDNKNRRIFLSTEFNPENGRHKSENLIYSNKNRLKANYPRILDSNVIDINTGEKVALSKNDFAKNILNKKDEFGSFTFENFRPLFEIFLNIIK